MGQREILEKIWWAGVHCVGGDVAVRNALAEEDCNGFTHILAAGKAAASMARAALELCDNVEQCLILTKYGHDEDWTRADERVSVIEAGHPVPDENSLEAGRLAIEFVSGLKGSARLLFLVSGGGSAIVEQLPAGVSLQSYQALTSKLISNGLNIHQINEKRSELSEVKGGKLLARFKGQEITSLAISDVEGDDITVIASGIGSVMQSNESEAFKARIIASNYIARQACEDLAEDADLEVIVNSENLYGDVYHIAKQIARTVIAGAPGLYIFGGEPTIILPPNPGNGGRSQALAVALAREFSGIDGVGVLAAGSDGTDGPDEIAGGYVTGSDWQNFDGGQAALDGADSGAWLKTSGGLFISGPTGTNVMDLCLVLKA